MRNVFFLLIICFVFASCNTQNSYELLNEAEILYHEGKSDEALKKTDLALRKMTASCGMGIIEITSRGAWIEYQIHQSNSNYKLARQSIEYSPFSVRDSLMIVAYQAEFGKSYFRKIIDKSLPNTSISEDNYTHYAKIPLKDIGETISFEISFSEYNECYVLKNEQEAKEEWLSSFINSPTYALIKSNK